jgi:hypothetical protein
MAIGRDPVNGQHRGQHLGQRAFRPGRRGHMVAAGGQMAGPARRGQALAVGLAAGQHRDGRQLLQVGRDHVRGQPLAQLRVDPAGVHGGRVAAGAVVGGQLRDVRSGLAGADHGLRDAGHPEHDRLDLGQLDAVPTDLDLGVDAAVMLDLALGVQPSQVAGPVDPAPWVVRDAQEVGHEGALGEVRAAHVSAGQPGPRDADLPHLTRR